MLSLTIKKTSKHTNKQQRQKQLRKSFPPTEALRNESSVLPAPFLSSFCASHASSPQRTIKETGKKTNNQADSKHVNSFGNLSIDPKLHSSITYTIFQFAWFVATLFFFLE